MTPASSPPTAGLPATRDVVVVGGGLAGLAAGWRLARAGLTVAVLEAEPVLGGQARSFEQGGRRLPIAYHHVNPRDATLVRFLGALGLLSRVAWRRVQVACLVDGRAHVLASPRGFLGYPAGVGEKARMALATLRTWRGRDDLALHDVDAATWLRGEVGEGELLALFDRLARLRLGVGADEVSAAWLRARLASREGATRMGCIPGQDWTALLVDALAQRARAAGAQVRVASEVTGLVSDGGRWRVSLADGAAIEARAVLGALAPPLLARLLPPERAAPLQGVRWSSAVSVVLGVADDLPLRAYWTNVVRPARLFGAAFRLDRLNPELAAPGEALLNLAAYGPDEPGALVREPPERIIARFREAWAEAFGQPLQPRWSHVTRLPLYSPVFAPGYRNPAIRQPGTPDLWLAGAALTWPQVTSTGPALGSGWGTAGALLAARGLRDREEPG